MIGNPNIKWYDPSTIPDKLKNEEDLVSCTTCGCKWLEVVVVQQFSKLHFLQLGQKPATVGEIGFYLFRCPKCNNVMEPHVQVGATDVARKAYDKFYDHMLEPIPTEKK